MRRDVQAIILILVGGATLRISLGDTMLNYVKEAMRPWLLLSGGILVLLGILALIDVIRSARKRDGDHDHGGEPADASTHAHGHDHSQGPRAAWFLLLPVLTIFLVAPPALGAYSAARDTTNAIQPREAKAPPLPPGDPASITVADYVGRAVWDDGLTLVDREVELTGFVTPAPDGGWWLTRMSVACCAADAFASKILVLDAEPLPADTWVTVTGTWVPGGGTQSTTAVPLIAPTSIVEVSQPRNPYE